MFVVRMKKARLEIKRNRLDEALHDIDAILLSTDSDNPEACILKGRIMEKQGHVGDAALNYEQAAKNTDLASKALFKLAKMRLRLKDYYEAHFNIKRAFQYNPCDSKMQLYRTLIDGVLIPV